MITKQCSKCETLKPIDEFGNNVRNQDGKELKCKACINAYLKEYYKRKPREKKPKPQWDPEACKRRKLARDKHALKKRYGITPEIYYKLIAAQDYRCGICGSRHSDHPDRRLAIDHDHKTGEVRMILCGTCNRGLGLLEGRMKNLDRAVEYLRLHHRRYESKAAKERAQRQFMLMAEFDKPDTPMGSTAMGLRTDRPRKGKKKGAPTVGGNSS